MYDVYDPALAQEPIKKIILQQLLNKMRPNSLFTTHELNARVSFSNRLLSIVHLLSVFKPVTFPSSSQEVKV